MQAKEVRILDFLKVQDQQFVIPIYQRNYDWTTTQCKQLLNDIQKISTKENNKIHFLGSIVYVMDNQYQATQIKELNIVDGQQRLTTISLLILAMVKYLKEDEREEIYNIRTRQLINQFLVNEYFNGEEYIKLQHSIYNKEQYCDILLEKKIEDKENNMYKNFDYFYEQFKKGKIRVDTIYKGLGKLMIVDVSLNRQYDNPQLIFESLNSTGLNLNDGDLIRNYILMNLDDDIQRSTYEEFWKPMELKIKNMLSDYVRTYLIMKLGRNVNNNNLYEEFKEYCKNKNKVNIAKELHDHSDNYSAIISSSYKDCDINNKLEKLNKLGINIMYPLLLRIISDYENNIVDKKEIIKTLNTFESYFIRRLICGIDTKGLNLTMPRILKYINDADYSNSIINKITNKSGTAHFPNDTEFEEAFLTRDIYNLDSKVSKYILDMLENSLEQEKIDIDNLTIEHIMPQTLMQEWKSMLGEDYEFIHEKYLHNIGNLTLSGYNSELGNKSFIDKKEMTGGYNDSPLRINEYVKSQSKWTKKEIIERSCILAKKAVKIWFKPYVEKEGYNLDDEWKGRKLSKIIFESETYEVSKFTDLYNLILALLYQKYNINLLNAMNKITNIKYYSKESEHLRKPQIFPELNLYLEYDFSPEDFKVIIKRIFEVLEIDENTFILYFK